MGLNEEQKLALLSRPGTMLYVGAEADATSTEGDVTEAEVLACQGKWANAIKTISKTYLDKGDYIQAAADAAGELYGYGHSDVLFKPTKATKHPFRPTGEEAMSYFVGAEAMGADEFKGEDAGFAINGGRGWKDVTFRNHQVELYGEVAHAMGDYVFTDATSGDKVRVEYTFAYKRCDDGQIRICLHHSSVPYTPAKPSLEVTKEEVLAAQDAWASSIKTISAVYRNQGDFIQAASNAAAELYGYGHSNVLFKPTKAAEEPFRPTGAEAMSYFVGKEAVEAIGIDGYDEDGASR